MRNPSSRPPTPPYGPRWSRGVSARGAQLIRRSVIALAKQQKCQTALYTLTSQDPIADREFKKRVGSFLAWGRKYCPEHFRHYVIVYEPQARGVIHAHMLLFKRIPKGLWRRMRALWAERYEMGPGSFDSRTIRHAAAAAKYLAKYVSKKHDDEGVRVGRNGQPYETEYVMGNSYQMSDSLRRLAQPVAEHHLPWHDETALKLGVTLRGGVLFFDSPEEAAAWFDRSRSPPLDAVVKGLSEATLDNLSEPAQTALEPTLEPDRGDS